MSGAAVDPRDTRVRHGHGLFVPFYCCQQHRGMPDEAPPPLGLLKAGSRAVLECPRCGQLWAAAVDYVGEGLPYLVSLQSIPRRPRRRR